MLAGLSSSLLAGTFHHDDNFVTEQANFLHTKLPLALTRGSQSHPGAMRGQKKSTGKGYVNGVPNQCCFYFSYVSLLAAMVSMPSRVTCYQGS